ncbi:MAG TPA: hypothetical protein VJ729_02670 [Nitrososphaeraceae archaeon]|nr:hypothetical protein [Nitrososphaeraceae archaeon]
MLQILAFDLEEELDRREIASGIFPELDACYFLERAIADIIEYFLKCYMITFTLPICIGW